MGVEITLFRHLEDRVPKLHTLDGWGNLVHGIGQHRPYNTRDAVPLFSPATFNGSRKKDNVVQVNFAVLDFDDTPEQAFVSYLELLQQEHLAFMVYSTWSHPQAVASCKVRCRVVLPFDKPVPAEVWPNVFAGLYQHTGMLSDPVCSDASRMYFFPSLPPGQEEKAFYLVCDGQPIITERFSVPVPREIALSIKRSVGRHQFDDIGVKDLQRLLVSLQRGKTPYKVWLHEKLTLLLAGDSLAGEGERDKTIWDLICGVLDAFPRANPEHLEKLFAPSLQAMNLEAPGCPTPEQVLEKIRRKQEAKADEVAVVLDNTLAERSRLIAQAFGFSGRDKPYTAEELRSFCDELDLPSLDHLNKYWIIQRGKSYYALVGGEYKGPCGWEELTKVAQVYLAPAYTSGVETTQVTPSGRLEPKSGESLMLEYGSLATQVNISLFAQKSSYDPKTETITEAPCKLRHTTPLHDASIEQWLLLLGGESADKLFEWLSVVPRISEPCAALYLEGARGVGKSLLAIGVASLWSNKGPVGLTEAMADFNESVMKCPVLFADETIPTDFRGQARTAELRQLIQARVRPVKRKFLPVADLYGCCRLIMAANNGDLLKSSEHLTVNDIEAIVDRFVHIDATKGKAAREYLESQPKETLKYWANEGIARYVLWLAENFKFDDKHRFLVAGNKTTLHRRLTVGSGVRSAVCCWLVGYLLEPRKVDVTREYLVRVVNKQLLVNVRALVKSWGTYDTTEKSATVAELSRALKSISFAETKQLTDGTGKKTHYYVVDTKNLLAWTEDFGYTTAEEILVSLNQETKMEKVRGTK